MNLANNNELREKNTILIRLFSIYIMTLFTLSYDNSLNKITQVLFLLILILFIFKSLRRHIVFNIDYVTVSLFILLLYASVSYFWSIDKSYAFQKNITLYQLFLLYISLSSIINKKNEIQIIVKGIYFGGIIMMLYALIVYNPIIIISSIFEGIRIGGEINQENAFGFFCSIVCVLSMYYLFYYKKRFDLVIFFLSFVLVIASGSRKALMITIISIFILFLLKKGNLKYILSFIFIIAFTIFIYFFSSNQFFENYYFRVAQIINIFGGTGYIDSSLMIRNTMLQFGWSLFIDNPIFGYGTEQYQILFKQFYYEERPPHNTYLQLMVSYGLFGLLLYYGIHLRNLIKLWDLIKNNDKFSILIFVLIIMFLLNDFGSNMMLDKFSFIIIAISSAYIKITKKELRDKP